MMLKPTIHQRIIDAAMAGDPQVARTEWLAEWRDDLSSPFAREMIEAAVDVDWAAAGSEDTELGVLMEPEVGHGTTEVYRRVQA
jgi:hypothetical protein